VVLMLSRREGLLRHYVSEASYVTWLRNCRSAMNVRLGDDYGHILLCFFDTIQEINQADRVGNLGICFQSILSWWSEWRMPRRLGFAEGDTRMSHDSTAEHCDLRLYRTCTSVLGAHHYALLVSIPLT
jgi:hypothetical protein